MEMIGDSKSKMCLVYLSIILLSLLRYTCDSESFVIRQCFSLFKTLRFVFFFIFSHRCNYSTISIDASKQFDTIPNLAVLQSCHKI